jgi:hypothetical protein
MTAILHDLRYALRQLRKSQDCSRRGARRQSNPCGRSASTKAGREQKSRPKGRPGEQQDFMVGLNNIPDIVLARIKIR